MNFDAQNPTEIKRITVLDETEREREVPDGNATLRRDVTVAEDVDGGVRRHNAAVCCGGEMVCLGIG